MICYVLGTLTQPRSHKSQYTYGTKKIVFFYLLGSIVTLDKYIYIFNLPLGSLFQGRKKNLIWKVKMIVNFLFLYEFMYLSWNFLLCDCLLHSLSIPCWQTIVLLGPIIQYYFLFYYNKSIIQYSFHVIVIFVRTNRNKKGKILIPSTFFFCVCVCRKLLDEDL